MFGNVKERKNKILSSLSELQGKIMKSQNIDELLELESKLRDELTERIFLGIKSQGKLVACPKKLAEYRLIALCNVIYKVSAKVLTNRLKRVMLRVISDNQSMFVAGRPIQDHIIVVHEILHFLNNPSKDDLPDMAIKLNMAKAYDHME